MMLLECVSELNASEVLSEELLIELYALDSNFDREVKLQEIQKRAEELKIKPQFNRINKAFMQDNKKLMDKDYPSYVTEFGDKPPLSSGVWRADMNGIWTLSEKGRIYACSHPIFPSAVLTNIESKTCKVKLEYFVRNKWNEIFVDRKIIASRSSIVALASHGIRVTSENAGALVQYLSDIEALNEDVIVERKSTSRLGWIDNSFMPFDGDVIFDNENNVGTLFNSICVIGSYDKWLKCVKEQRKSSRIETLICLAASFASVLVEPLGALPFVVDLWGGTGRGKTVTLMLATSIWANPNEGEYITDAKTTQTAMEIRLDVLNSLPMFIDDMAQIKNKVEDFAQLIYLLCSGSGKGRATKEAGLKNTYSWKNCIVTTTEHSLISETMQSGAINRVIDVECGNSDIYEDAPKVADIVRKNYGYAGRRFITYIEEIGFEAIQQIQKKYFDKLIQMSKDSGNEKEQKQVIPMAALLTADEIAEKYIFQDGIRLDIDTCFNLLKNKNDISEGIRAYNYLIETVVSNSYKFEEPNEAIIEHFERWGKYIDADKVAIIGKFFDKIITEAGSNTKAFLSWAKSKGILELDANGNPKKTVSYDGQKLRSVVIRLDYGMDFEDSTPNEIPFEE